MIKNKQVSMPVGWEQEVYKILSHQSLKGSSQIFGGQLVNLCKPYPGKMIQINLEYVCTNGLCV